MSKKPQLGDLARDVVKTGWVQAHQGSPQDGWSIQSGQSRTRTPMKYAGIMSLFLLAAPVVAETYVVPASRSGGGVNNVYIQMVLDFMADGTDVRITLPSCSSACTYFLIVDEVCVDPDTIFGFHGPSEFIFGITGIPIQRMPTKAAANGMAIATAVIAANYDTRWPGMGDWYLAGPAKKYGLSMTRVKGQSLHDTFGVPLCK